MTTTRPATPLPKLAFSVTSAEIVSADWRGRPLTEKLSRDEQREVIRRANAYPELVAMLDQAIMYMDYAANHVALGNPLKASLISAAGESRALLAKLGEQS